MTNEWTRKIDEQDAKIKELKDKLKIALQDIPTNSAKIFDADLMEQNLNLKTEVTSLKKTLSEISNGISSLEGIKE